MNVFDQQAGSRLGASASSTVTVPAGFQVTRILWCADTSAGSVTITPAGANTTGSALAAITVPANSGWMGISYLPGELGPGTVIAFATCASQYVYYNKLASGV